MADQMASGTRDPKARYDIGALEQRVSGTENALRDIQSSISALGTKIDERSRTPWATLIATFAFLLAFMSTVGFLAYKPIESDLARHERLIDKIQDRYTQDLKDEIRFLRGK